MLSNIAFFSSLALLTAIDASPVLQARHVAPLDTQYPSYEAESPVTWSDLESSALVPIHPSCNLTLRTQLETAIEETFLLAENAKKHLLYYGHESPYVQKYFGNGSTAVPIGWYDRVISANKTGMLLRCDDPDGNCARFPDYYAGHWRGSNATQETVICPLSFQPGKRRHLDAVCGNGYTVAGSPLNTFWAVDLLHRFFHVPKISEDVVSHYADDYNEVVELAQTNATYSGIDSDALQYFAIDVYAFDVAVPGTGCTGQAPPPKSSSGAVAAPATTSAATTTAQAITTTTTSAGAPCHTHSDGVVHCGSD